MATEPAFLCPECGESVVTGEDVIETSEAGEDCHARCLEWECDETCASHLSTCDGFCDHLAGHRNACVEAMLR